MSDPDVIERVARAIRGEIVRQFRDDERGKCPAGAHYYEENIGPYKIASAAIAAMRKPTKPMIEDGASVLAHAAEPFAHHPFEFLKEIVGEVFEAMIDEALTGTARSSAGTSTHSS
jgi:hypothetical protein